MSIKLPRVIVLMTDFGLNDTYVGQMKGVILSLAPSVQIIDLTHSVAPQNIAQGAFLLGKSASFFPRKINCYLSGRSGRRFFTPSNCS